MTYVDFGDLYTSCCNNANAFESPVVAALTFVKVPGMTVINVLITLLRSDALGPVTTITPCNGNGRGFDMSKIVREGAAAAGVTTGGAFATCVSTTGASVFFSGASVFFSGASAFFRRLSSHGPFSRHLLIHQPVSRRLLPLWIFHRS